MRIGVTSEIRLLEALGNLEPSSEDWAQVDLLSKGF